MQLLSRHEGLALIGAIFALAGLALAVTGTGSPMFSRRHPAGGPAGLARRVGLAVLALGAAAPRPGQGHRPNLGLTARHATM